MRKRHLDSLTDDNLIALSLSGESAAFDALFRRYERSVYNLAYRLSGNHQDAQEVVAESFLRIWRNLSSVQRALGLTSWISKLVANVFFDMRRRHSRRPSSSLEALVEVGGDVIFSTGAAGLWSPERHLEAGECRRMVNHAISELPASYQPIVRLYHLEGRTYTEIADALKIPIGTVKSRLHHARSALRLELAHRLTEFAN